MLIEYLAARNFWTTIIQKRDKISKNKKKQK